MRKSFLFVSAAAVVCLSCAKENIAPEEESSVKTVITVGIDQTKTTIGESEGGKHKIYWANGDVLCANGVSSDALSGVGEKQTSTTFVFNGIVNPPVSFLYPAAYWKDDETVTLPGTQDSAVADLPLYGYSKSNLTANLNVLTAALQISLKQGEDKDDIKYIQLSSETQPLSGTFTIDYKTGEILSAAAAADSKIRLNANCALSAEDSTTFVFSIPAGSYGLTVKVVDVNAHCMTKTLSDKTFTAGKYIILPKLTFEPTTTEFDIHITTAAEWNTFAEAYNAGTIDQRCSAQIDNDIDFSSTKAVALSTFDGILYGGNNSFLSLDKPLIYNVSKTGVVKNVVIDEKSSFTVDVEDANARYGFIANSNYGTITGCTVKGAIGFEIPNGAASEAGFFGGIAGRSFGDIIGCTYSGTMSNTCATSVSRQGYVYVGGITGDANTADNSVSTGNVKDCTFSGKILLGVNAGNVDDVSYDGITCANTTGVRIGGIAGRAQNSNVVDNCSTTSDALIDVRGSQLVLYAGGIAGYDQSTVKNCTNNTRVKVIETKNDSSGGNAYIGGIAGRVSGTIESSKNSADSLVARNNNRSNCVGGIAGQALKDAKIISSSNNAKVAQGQIAGRYLYIGGIVGFNISTEWSGTIANNGKVSIGQIPASSQYSTSRMGGVIGYNEAAINGNNAISNDGEIYFSNTNVAGYKNVSVGGVIGYSKADVMNVKNTGKLTLFTSKAVLPKEAGTEGGKYNQYYQFTALGGVVGSTDAAITISGCTTEFPYDKDNPGILANITATTAYYNTNWCEGGILGYTNAAVTVSDCTNNSYIKHNANAKGTPYRASFTGGIVGKIDTTAATITSCTHSNKVHSNNYNSTSTFTIDNAPYLGGIVGAIIGKSATEKAKISACTVSFTTAEPLYSYRGISGGIAGYASYAVIGGENETDKCKVSNKIYGNSNATYNGGIVGWAINSSIQKCECNADIGQIKIQGGIVANLDTGSAITDCIFNGTMTKGTQTSATDPKAIASCSVSGATITNCGLAGTIAGTAITSSNYNDYICNDTNATISGCYFYEK